MRSTSKFSRAGSLARRRPLLIAVTIAVVFAAAAGIAYANIPDSSGVIHGCYKKTSPQQGTLRVVDSEKGQTCGASENTLNWNQMGPRGARGPSDAYLAADDGKTIDIGGTTLATLTLPAGNYTIEAKTGVYSIGGDAKDDIVDCLLKAGNTTIDEDQVRIDGLGAGTNDDNEFMNFIGTASFGATETVSLVCSSSFSSSESTKLLATQVETLH
jgi:hypothetical protein